MSWQMYAFQTRKNIAIAEDFRIHISNEYNNVVFMNVVIEMKLHISFFQTIANRKLIYLYLSGS